MNMQKLKPPHSQRGFTLLEVLMVVVIIGIISSIALPNYRTFIVSNRSTTNAALLHGAITHAKTLAGISGAVTMCKSDNPDAPVPICSSLASNGASNTGWGSGWILFQDKNANGQYDAGDTLIKVQPALFRSVTEGSIVPQPNTQSITLGGIGGTVITGTAMYFYVKPPDDYVNATYNRYVCVSSVRKVSVVKTLPCPT
ncbi:GspH/FimT family pseudopilin [Undibacterium sp. JH2W]|uniref:GspH/FimT family pseudopilin n=1 Tax=Undibacterium sp. JH2W TaxID=3413037 RepID=UPI003BF28064